MLGTTVKFALMLLVGSAVTLGSIEELQAQSEKRPAYLVAEIDVTNPDAYKAYEQKAMETLKPYNVRIVANGKPDVKDGAPAQGNILILAFDSMEDAQKWYDSSPYKELISERQKTAKTRIYFVEGPPPR